MEFLSRFFPVPKRSFFLFGPRGTGKSTWHLRAWIAYSNSDCKLYYWRTRAGVEVDFVVYGGDGFWAIEVKNTATVRPQDLRALKRFRDDYPECEPIFLYRGEERLLVDGIRCVPGEEFLLGMVPSRGLTET